MKFSHILLSGLVVLVWGMGFVFSKAGVEHFSPFTITFLRFFFAAILLLPFYPKPPAPIKNIAKAAFSFAMLHVLPFFFAMRLGLDASVAGIADQFEVPISIVLASILLHEKVGIKTISGVIVAFIGMFVLFGTPNVFNNPLPLCLMVIAGCGSACYNISLKNIQYDSVLHLSAWIALLAIPMLLPCMLLFESDHMAMLTTASLSAWSGALYMSIIAYVIGHGTWYYLIKHNPIATVSPVLLLIPLVSIMAGWFFYDEEITKEIILGAVLMITGVALVIIRKPEITDTDMGL